jgi:hypothetical protein
MAPLRRRPKQLDAEPRLVDASPVSGGTGGLVVPGGDGRSPHSQPSRPGARTGSGGPAVTDEPGTLTSVPDGPAAADRQTLRRARQIATRLALPRPRRDTSGERDAGLARELARLGHGRLRRIRAYTDVAPALSAIFTD